MAAVEAAAAAPPVRVEVVDDATLAGINGKYLGANMLVGLRIDIVSSVHAPGQTQAHAAGSLLVRRTGAGYDVAVDTRAHAEPGAGAPSPTGIATGGEALQVAGIGQVTQIAGNGNAMSNLTTIRFVSNVGTASGFNGAAASAAAGGGVSAQIAFGNGGVRLDLNAPGALLGQHIDTHALHGAGGVMQIGQLTGNGIVAHNQLHLQIATELMPSLWQHQLGVQQALSGLQGLSR
ncbi:hypothetical protein GCM10007067_26230 [Lysobacter bugurensis]|uniref:Uncharacterized protein n=1 Tax=Cognatilysobacter bugurensis TaxID=543356 RepID=A0A918T226_9GAMM|nr:hypothetical protein GCM10007067_26230 [Lysobacter bugurensis]